MLSIKDDTLYKFLDKDVSPDDFDEIPVVTLAEQALKVRMPPQIRGKKFSMVALGLCNFNCPYCVQGGGMIERLKLPKVRMVRYGQIKEWIKAQSKSGNPIKVTGGEPLLMPSVTRHMLYEIKKNMGYSCLETNGSLPHRIEGLLPYVDLLCVDIKGSRKKGGLITNIQDPRLYWYNPIETLKIAENQRCDIEVRTVTFNSTTLEDLVEISQKIPSKAYWTIKRFVPEIMQFDGSFVSYRKWFNDLQPLEEKLLLAYADKLIEQNPSLRGRLVIVVDQANIDVGVIK